MANISLTNFVDVNIQRSTRKLPLGTRKECVLLTDEGSSSTVITLDSNSDYSTTLLSMPTSLAYADMYFKNGGEELVIYPQISIDLTDSSSTATTVETIVDLIKSLPDEDIVIALAYSADDGELGCGLLSEVNEELYKDITIYGIKEKIIIARTNTMLTETESAPINIKNFAIKYSNIVGAEMTIAAYLSQINVYGINTIQDYMFTQETITAEDIDNETYQSLIKFNYNVDIDLQGVVRNCGGNIKYNSESLVNTFIRIVLQQTLTDRLISLITTKIKSTDGISKMYATCVDELEYYRVNGYLTTDKVWEYDDWVSPEGMTVIEKGTPLLTGYQVKIVPFSMMTPDQKAQHKAPNIYIALADQYYIRIITVRGEVI